MGLIATMAALVLGLLGAMRRNRLSDHLFVASRAANDGGAKDVLWVPGANR